MKSEALYGVPDLPGNFSVLFYGTNPIHLSQFVVIPLNEFRIHGKCMNLIQKWSVTLNVCL